MGGFWRRVQHRPWWFRWPTKFLILLVVVFLVLYPKPHLFVRWVQRLQHLDRLPDPNEPTLQLVADRFDRYLGKIGVDNDDPAAMLQAVNQFVKHEIPYGWDWDVWGVVDYVPTVAEIIDKGQEDCDGRAVLAAALLRRRGIDAKLVGDTRHMWVSTPMGDAMDPLGQWMFQHTKQGMNIRWRGFMDPGPYAFGVAVFPLGRELIILLTVWLLLLPADATTGRAAFALFMLIDALVLLRLAGANPIEPRYGCIAWAAAHMLAAVFVLGMANTARRRTF